MNTRTVKYAAALSAAALSLPALAAPHAAPKARISPAQAEAAAVKAVPGRAQSAKYEFEDGHWQYAVIVRDAKGQLYEAEVNAATGRVTATEKTSAAEEASEAAADRKAALHAKPGARRVTPAAPEQGEKGNG